MTKINVSKLIDNKEAQEDFCLDIKDLPGELVNLVGSLKVVGKIFPKVEAVLLVGHISGKEKVICDKCAEEFESLIERDFSQEYVLPGSDDIESEYDEKAGYLIDEAGLIDIGKAVLEEILVADNAPHLCKKDCKGLCPVCGINLNKNKCSCYTNSGSKNPFAKLKELKEK